MSWVKGLAEWTENQTAYLSVAFSWKALEAKQKAIEYQSKGFHVRIGGPGIFTPTIHRIFDGVGELGGEVEAITHHNPNATFASRGCPVGCYFCIVPKLEGKEFTLIPDFIPRPILCDNNLSALPIEYQDHIIERYQKFDVPLLDANSGFEPRVFDDATFQRWKKINQGAWRFGYDESKEEQDVYRMTQILKSIPAQKKRVYVLIGNEPIESCLRRVMQVIEWKCEPFVQPIMALNSLEKKPMIHYDWTERKLKDMTRWANKWLWRKISFAEYDYQFVTKERRLA
jgi:hypothetical protein